MNTDTLPPMPDADHPCSEGIPLDTRPCNYASGFEDGQSETQLAAELALSDQEVHSKETMDEVREALKKAGDYAHFLGASTTCAACFSALAKLNPPQ